MRFPDQLYLLAWLGGFLCTLAATPWWRQWCRRAGHMDAPGHRKIHREPTPLAGGPALLTGLVLPLAMAWLVLQTDWLDAGTRDRLLHGLARRGGQLGVVLLGALGMCLLGWRDDRRPLTPGIKFAWQAAIALAVAASGVRITLFVHSPVFAFAVTVLWILTVTNAVNIMDNMNGLCAGLGIIGTFCFAVAAGLGGQYLVTALALLMCGALCGFLPYNFPRASAFLGDSGSHLVGYLLAVLAILPDFYSPEHPRPLAVLTPLLVLAVPLGDMLVVMWIRRRLGRPIWEGDTNHLSHRLVRRGWTPVQAVLLIWLISAACGAVALGVFLAAL
ncbi:MAG: undecaprenyl/decaprenyl-phosphate alpha-N-acetylglucosaminyl 1-phosphate transferase [Verrucomicrobia bacterium]|nr:MAG: undecaprenyl/decaprenyl-phosphate alpha-N-acetylglucosaminyl 1-phosphate transferase [Verrucomicrobiota bacterium]